MSPRYRPAHEFNKKFSLLSQTAYSLRINPLTSMSDQNIISPYITNIIGIVWETEKRITYEILGVKGLTNRT